MFVYDKFTEEIININEIINMWKKETIDNEDKTIIYKICILFKNRENGGEFIYNSKNQQNIIFNEIYRLLDCVEIGY
jgi:hypothetical protein